MEHQRSPRVDRLCPQARRSEDLRSHSAYLSPREGTQVARWALEAQSRVILETRICIGRRTSQPFRILSAFLPSLLSPDTDREEFSIQKLNESYGDGNRPEEMTKTFSKLQIWVLQTVQDAEEQKDTAIQFFKSIGGESTIAIGGYATGLSQLSENRQLSRARGTMFILNYM